MGTVAGGVIAAAGAGAAVASGTVGAAATAGVVGLVWLAAARRAVGPLAAGVALAGSLVLLYGFANVGIPGPGAVIPVTEVLLLTAFAWAVGVRPGPAGRRALLWWVALALLAGIRLLASVPAYGITAARDALTVVEGGFLLVGYRLGREHAWATVRFLRWVFLACAAYFAAYPAADLLARLGPVVGIQRPVPLLGQYAGADTVAIAGFFFMALLRPFGRWSYWVAAAFLGELLLFQGRGAYLAFLAAATLLLGYAGAGGRAVRLRKGVAAGVVAGILVGVLLFPISPPGRLGPVSPGFYAEHVQTLLGREGPGSGTIRDRLRWIQLTMSRVLEEPMGPLTGVGFGPDLIGGFAVEEGVQVRKPHNDYLEVFARLGIPGLFIFLGLLGSIAIPVLRGARRGPPAVSRILWWVTAVQVAYLIVAAVQPILAFPYGTVPLFTLSGFGLALVDRGQQLATRGSSVLSRETAASSRQLTLRGEQKAETGRP